MSESKFWALKSQAIQVGLTPARMGQLAKLCQDYDKAYQVLHTALQTKNPSAYLGKVIANLRDEQAPPQINIPRSHEPEIALQARLRGWPVRKTALSDGSPGWWVAGTLYNREGFSVGG